MSPRVLVIDNYDSFVYNLVQYLGELGAELQVVRNDGLALEEAVRRPPDCVVVSPGPGRPSEAGVSIETIRRLGGLRIPVLGVCLGHQAVAEAFGGEIVYAPELMHGKTSMVHHDGRGLFAGIDSPFEATRYHSLAVEREGLPACLEVTAWTPDGLIMGVRHRSLPIFGVQFHPESIKTVPGKNLLENFLCCTKSSDASAAART